ncbi:hypothetical protein BGZ57DRAFT_939900 [Hyaloscypha finlandica]|nr:hypothetical protein BGZ57DRAFT_939900 [Hyaloscypha finlandica]
MPLPTYENQSTWKEIQKFLPESTHFDESHTPVEERWGNRSHTVHLDRRCSPGTKVRVIMHHGLGTNGRQVSLLFDWVTIGDDFVNFECEHDPRPVVLCGLSARGMLNSHIAALNKKPKLFAPIPFLHNISIPFYLASKMWALANDPAAMKIFMGDRTSAARWTSMRFLSSGFTGCPILQTKPEKDLWSPLPLAKLSLKRVKKVDVKIVVLENAGYYPLEQSGGTDARGHPIISQGYRGFYLDSVKISFLAMFEFLSLLD